MTSAWAEACRQAINASPDAERKASKLQDFWDWINMVKPFVTGRLALCVRDMPEGTEGDTLVLDFTEGTVAAASFGRRSDLDPEPAFLLAGSHADWQAMLGGYDVGKMVMYRKLMMEVGDTLRFFTAAFFWTEMLAAIQSVPTDDRAPVAA